MVSAAIASSPDAGVTQLQVNGSRVDRVEAFEVVLGYAFEEVDIAWRPEPLSVGPRVACRVPRRAYRSYDCVAAGEGCTLADIDILLPTAIDARMNGAVVAGLRAVSAELSVQVAALDERAQVFWEYDERAVGEQPADGDQAWPLWRAWSIVEAVPGAGIAVTHKVLHHKRPSVFPLLDNKTYAELGSPSDPWRRIHQDLTATESAWKVLEAEFEAQACQRGGTALTRLRLHDILLWTRAVDQWNACRAAGVKLLNR